MALALGGEPVGTHHGMGGLQNRCHVLLAHQFNDHHGAVVPFNNDIHGRFKGVLSPLRCNPGDGLAHKGRAGAFVDEDLVPAGGQVQVFKDRPLSLEIPDHLSPQFRCPQPVKEGVLATCQGPGRQDGTELRVGGDIRVHIAVYFQSPAVGLFHHGQGLLHLAEVVPTGCLVVGEFHPHAALLCHRQRLGHGFHQMAALAAQMSGIQPAVFRRDFR